jgi:hypothetical protein
MEPSSLGRLLAHVAIAWVVFIVGWWFIWPHPKHNNDVAVFVVCAAGSTIAALLIYRKK